MARKFILTKEADLPISRLSIPYQDELNEQQFEVVTSGSGPVLVVAGAGTGKTRTLVYRVAYLVETGVAPEQIVLLTFTRRSANEMLNRASGLLDGRCKLVRGGTFHAFCLTILKQHAPKLGFPSNFTILDSSDAADVIDVVRATAPINTQGKRFPRKNTLLSIFSAVRNKGANIEAIVEKAYPQFTQFVPEIESLFEVYSAYKKAHGLMDYDDLLILTIQLLQGHPSVLREVASACRYVLVDEYQDTNRAQAVIVQALASVHHNVMAVGDDAQSIYGFRGADFRNILGFSSDFEGARILKLEHNYRSTQKILDLANVLLDDAKRKYDKRLFTQKTGGDLPGLVPAPDDRFQSRFVAQLILQFREQGIPLQEMAVLFRNGHNSFDLEIELNKKNIPFVKYGGLKLAEAAHIKDLLAHLRVIENPKDTVAWNRILQLLEGVGPKTAGRIIDWIETEAAETFELRERPFSAAYIESLRALFVMLRSVKQSDASPSSQIESILAYYAPILKRVYYEDFPKREQDLEHLVGITQSFQDRASLLDSLALDPVELTAIDTDPEKNDEPPLTLSTIHSSKGLEFKVVFIIHALDGVIPSSFSVGEEDSIEEERRLLYVAVTRAAEQLYISYPTLQFRRYEGQYFTKPSRFLETISPSVLEICSLVEETPAELGSHASALELPPASTEVP
ncbi:ATP-dependent helicase [bacterium]|nr:ATP-dependent helicase [bacterium]